MIRFSTRLLAALLVPTLGYAQTSTYVLRAGRYQAGTTSIVNSATLADTQARFNVDSSGLHSWGPGTGATDTSLARTATDTLTLGAGSGSVVFNASGLGVGIAPTSTERLYLSATVAGEMNARVSNLNAAGTTDRAGFKATTDGGTLHMYATGSAWTPVSGISADQGVIQANADLANGLLLRTAGTAPVTVAVNASQVGLFDATGQTLTGGLTLPTEAGFARGRLHVQGDTAATGRITSSIAVGDANGAVMRGYKARGTHASKAAVQAGDTITGIVGYAYEANGTATYVIPAEYYQTAEAISGDIVSGYHWWQTTNSAGVSAERARLNSEGLGVGAAATTTVPLNVIKNQNTLSTVVISNNNATASGAAQALFQAMNGTTSISFGITGTNHTNPNQAYAIAASGAASVLFGSQGASPVYFATNNVNRMEIDTTANGGRIRINTSADDPAIRFNVNGRVGVNAAGNSDGLTGKAGVAGTYIYGIGRETNGLALKSLDTIYFYPAATDETTAGTERMRLTSTGAVDVTASSGATRLFTLQSPTPGSQQATAFRVRDTTNSTTYMEAGMYKPPATARAGYIALADTNQIARFIWSDTNGIFRTGTVADNIGTTTGTTLAGQVVGTEVSSSGGADVTVGASGAQTNILSVSLTAGKWFIRGKSEFAAGASTVMGSDNYIGCSISTVSATAQLEVYVQGNPNGVAMVSGSCDVDRYITLGATTTIYLTSRHGATTTTGAVWESDRHFLSAIRLDL